MHIMLLFLLIYEFPQLRPSYLFDIKVIKNQRRLFHIEESI